MNLGSSEGQEILQRMQSNENNYKALVESLRDLVIKLDYNGILIYVNEACCRILDTSSQELIGHLFMQFVHEDDVDLLREVLVKLRSASMRLRVECRIKSVIGWRWIDWEVYVLKNGCEEDDFEIVAIGRDITTKKNAIQQVEKHNRDLSLLNQLSSALYVSSGWKDLLKRLKSLLSKDFGFPHGCLYSYDYEINRVNLETSWGFLAHMVNRVALANTTVVCCEKAMKDKRILEVSGNMDLLDIGPQNKKIEEYKNCMYVPLPAEGQIHGVLQLFYNDHIDNSPLNLEYYEILGQQVGGAIRDIRLTEQLRTSNRQLRTLSRKLVSMQETERLNIARDLHDEVGRITTGLTFALGISSNAGIADKSIEQARELVKELSWKIRDLALGLRPPMLDDLGLVPTLIWYFERFTDQTGIKVDFEKKIVDQRFHHDLEIAIFRIIQEALNNVARHAKTTDVTVRVWATSKTLGFQVEDNGVGFMPDIMFKRAATSGLFGMKERAQALDGALEIESSPGEGTLVTALFDYIEFLSSDI